MLAAHGFPGVAAAPTATYDLPNASLGSDPVKVAINGITYQMTISASQLVGPPSSPPVLDIDFDRTAGNAGSADQNHDYTFTPGSGIAFSYDSTNGKTAAIKASTAIAPSAVSITYKASSNDVSPCQLQDGSTGHQVFSSGTLTVSTFSFVSGTSPFFGTVTTKPKTARSSTTRVQGARRSGPTVAPRTSRSA